MNITSQNTRFASTRVGLTCVPDRSTACITPPRSSSWLSRIRRSTALGELLEHLRQQIAGEEDDERAEQRRQTSGRRPARSSPAAGRRSSLVVWVVACGWNATRPAGCGTRASVPRAALHDRRSRSACRSGRSAIRASARSPARTSRRRSRATVIVAPSRGQIGGLPAAYRGPDRLLLLRLELRRARRS